MSEVSPIPLEKILELEPPTKVTMTKVLKKLFEEEFICTGPEERRNAIQHLLERFMVAAMGGKWAVKRYSANTANDADEFFDNYLQEVEEGTIEHHGVLFKPHGVICVPETFRDSYQTIFCLLEAFYHGYEKFCGRIWTAPKFGRITVDPLVDTWVRDVARINWILIHATVFKDHINLDTFKTFLESKIHDSAEMYDVEYRQAEDAADSLRWTMAHLGQ